MHTPSRTELLIEIDLKKKICIDKLINKLRKDWNEMIVYCDEMMRYRITSLRQCTLIEIDLKFISIGG